jgi:hypothetical protein
MKVNLEGLVKSLLKFERELCEAVLKEFRISLDLVQQLDHARTNGGVLWKRLPVKRLRNDPNDQG